MNSLDLKALILLVVRLVVAATFIMAALPKIQDPISFTASVQGFQLVGSTMSKWTALILPWFELVIGIGLLVPAIRRLSGTFIAALLLVFIGLHASAWARGLEISCGCFGTEAGTTTDYRLLILRNLILLVATIWVVRRDCIREISFSSLAR